MKKSCQFCTKKEEPDYKIVSVLQQFLSDRAKIIGRSKTGLCQKHQKRLALAIKRARHLALLPYISRA